jgi:dTDP-4-dehydrorhamnose reductase
MGERSAALVVGADGIIGRALVTRLRRAGADVCATTRRPNARGRLRVDLAGDPTRWQLPPRASVAYLCAAMTSVEECEVRPQDSWTVNVDRTVALAERLVGRGVFVVFLSTDLVFDGSRPRRGSDESVSPRTEYGRQKAEAERRLGALGDAVAVVRLSKVFGPTVPLLAAWVDALRRRQVIRPFADMVLAPVPLGFTTDVLERVGTLRLAGLTQVSGPEDVSYEDLARYIAKRLVVPPALIHPMKAVEAGISPEAVSAYTTLDLTRLRSELGMVPPDVWSVVDAVLADYGVNARVPVVGDGTATPVHAGR